MNLDDKKINEKKEKKIISISSLEYGARTLTKDLIISILSMPMDKRALSQKMMLNFFCMNISKLPQKFI